jgi:amino acid adenylation domain-containing protein
MVVSLREPVQQASRAIFMKAVSEKTDKTELEAEEDVFVLPTSFAQQSLWFLDQLYPESCAYNVPRAIRILGDLDVKALECSLSEIVRRHEILRTTFRAIDGQPMQFIAPARDAILPVTDLRGLGPNEGAQCEHRLITEEAWAPFDLSHGPLLRVRLFRMGESEHVLIIVQHHIISDGWSDAVFMRELLTAYEAFTEGRQPQLPDLEVQYGDFAHWQREFLQGETFARQLEYWRSQLANLSEFEMPANRTRPPIRTFAGATESFDLPPRLTAILRKLGTSEHATLFVTLLAAFKALLVRYCGQEDIVVGAPIAKRGSAETKHLIGFFVNTVVMRTKLDSDPTFRVALRRVRQTVLGALEHSDLPFERLVEELAPHRTGNRNPFFQVMFDVVKAEPNTRKMGNLSLVPIDIENRSAKFDLMVELADGVDAIRGSLNYNRDLFDASTVRRMASHFRTLLEGIAADPDLRISQLPLLRAAERHQLVVEWNDTRRTYPTNVCLHELIEAQVARTPDAVAIVCEDESLSYRELNRRANQLAHHLRRLGVGPDAIVGVFAERSVEMIVALLATLKAGGAYLPLDPNYPAERLAFMLEDAQPLVVLAQCCLDFKLPQHASKVVFPEDGFAAESDLNPVNCTHSDNLAYVIFTSGSTGRPKGVMNTHRGICNWLLWLQETYRLTADDRILHKTPFTFDVSLGEFFWSLIAGSRLVVGRPALHGDSHYLIKTICENNITAIHFVPSMLSAFLEDVDASRCSFLRLVICIGEALSVELKERFFAVLPDAELHNLYGPTEAAVVVTYWQCKRGSDERIVPIGWPAANTQIYILDRAMQLVPTGVTGELHIGGVQLARGYLARAELTAEKFAPNPLGEGRLYKTGDLARYRSDGAIEFLGRIDHQVKLRGFRIELGEAESVLRQHELVKECAVLVRQDRFGDKRLTAYVVAPGELGENNSLPAKTNRQLAPLLRSYLQTKLPDYMVPAVFMLVDKLPLTSSGKLDRRALPEPERLGEELVEPSTPLQQEIAQIWKGVLGVERVGTGDDFFELGGHSLTALRLANQLSELAGDRVPVALVFQAPTVAQLAAQLEKHYVGDYAGKPAVDKGRGEKMKLPGGSATVRKDAISVLLRVCQKLESGKEVFVLPSSFAQQSLWLIDQLQPQSCEYNIPFAFRIRGGLDVHALARSFSFLAQRHEVLRTTFRAVDGAPMQFVAPARPVTLPITDLRELAAAERRSRARELIDTEALTPFDLAEGPLMRTKLLRTDDKEYVLFINFHHIIYDNWSHEILVHELLAAYQALVEGCEPELPELRIQYADYAHWQRELRHSKRFDEQLQYWRRQLSELPVLQIPIDRPRSQTQRISAANEPIELPLQLTHALKNLSEGERATFFMTMLAAFQVLLARYTGQEDIVVGSPITNRGHVEAEPLIGIFVNMLVLRTKLDGDPAFREVLRRVREMTLQAYQNQDLPLESVVEALAPKRDLGWNPLYQVMFNFLKERPRSYLVRDVSLQPIEIENRSAMLDLTLTLFDGQAGLRGCINYNADLFEAETVRRMVSHFRTLLEGIAADPDLRISQLPLLGRAERHQLLVEWNDTRRSYPINVCIHELVEAQVLRTPDAIALVFESASLTYHELNRRANRLAYRLRELGVGAEVIVGIFAERSVEMIVAVLATLKAGGAYLPLDPNYPAERLAFMLGETTPRVVLAQRGQLAKLARYEGEIVFLDKDFETPDDANLTSGVQAENLAYVLYTSGSTGKPKGVMVTHRSVCNRLLWVQESFHLTPRDCMMMKAPLTFDMSVSELFWPLISGARLVVARAGLQGDSQYLLDTICKNGVTILELVPAMVAAFLEEREVRRCLSLRRVISGGEGLSLELQERFFAALPHAELYNSYGPTETTIDVTFWKCERDAGDTTPPIGRPIANTQAYILDQAMQPVMTGTVGELHVGGAPVARGYLARAELTAEKFVPNPFGEGRLYKTGDLARWLPDGPIEYVSRIDQQVKIRGFRIEPGEIEAVLEQHPAVRDAVVVVREHSSSDKRLVAYVAGELSALSDTIVRDFLKARLPNFMLPSSIVALEKLPLNANGKVDRRALLEFGANPREKVSVPPRDPLEAQLVAIWEKVLRVEPIGVTDGFFELGGHSLMAARIFSQIKTMLGKDLPLATLFQTPTVEKLAAALREQGWKPAWSPLVPIQPRGFRAPFFAVHGGYGEVMFYSELARCLGRDQPFFGLQAEGLDGCAMSHTSIEAIARHYLQEIRQVQARGPYFLGGYCTGGVIAFEMAQQLHATGEEVAFLALFDTNNPEQPPQRSPIRKRIWLALDEASGLSLRDKPQYFARRVAHRLKWEAAKVQNAAYNLLELLYKTRKPDGKGTDGVPLPFKLPVWITLERATAKYKPRAYSGRIVLFRPTASDGYEYADDRGWTKVAEGGLEIHDLACKHGTIFEPVFEQRHMPMIAEKLAACIRHRVPSENL